MGIRHEIQAPAGGPRYRLNQANEGLGFQRGGTRTTTPWEEGCGEGVLKTFHNFLP